MFCSSKFCIYIEDRIKKLIDNIYSFLGSLLDRVPIFEPDRIFKFSFDIFMLFFLLLLIANIVLKFGFELNENSYNPSIWIVFEIFPPWLFFFEILLDLNTSYYSKGVYVSRRSKIFKHYLKHSFLLDVITIFPLLINDNEIAYYLEILVVLRLKNLDVLLKRLEEYLQLKGKKEGAFQLIKLIVSLLFLAHLCACAWHYVGIWEISLGVTDNWIYKNNIETEAWFIRYIYSFYFSIVTMMTVGYGDITANNYIECSFSICMIIYGCGVFAYSINNIGVIFKEMYQEDKDFK